MMPPPIDQTRREFLLKLARTAVFVPPLVASMDVRPLSAQGQGGGSGGGTTGGGKPNATTVGSLSPTAQTISNTEFQFGVETSEPSSAPWSPGGGAEPPPWSRPPPTQTGR